MAAADRRSRGTPSRFAACAAMGAGWAAAHAAATGAHVGGACTIGFSGAGSGSRPAPGNAQWRPAPGTKCYCPRKLPECVGGAGCIPF